MPFSNYCKPSLPSYYSHNLFKNTKLKGISQKNNYYYFTTTVGCTYSYNGEMIVYNPEYDFAEIHKNFSISRKLDVEIFKPINKTFSIKFLALFAGTEIVLDLPINLQNYLIWNFKRKCLSL
jgi:hypothetical protein